MIDIDPRGNPDLAFRIDSFFVPEAARAEFEAATHRNFAFIKTLPGFRGHVVFVKKAGPSSFNIVTIAVWENEAAIEAASAQVRAYYQKIGFDPAAAVAKWGAKGELGVYVAPADRQ